MVKICNDVCVAEAQINGKVINGDNHQEKYSFNAGKSDLPEPNLVLVNEARDLLKRHYEEDLERSNSLYSRQHYDELMDKQSPFTCWRYLLQTDENVQQAIEMMKSALSWRKENRIDVIEAKDLIKDFWLRAPIGFVGKTKDGTDLIYAVGKNYRKPDASIKQTIRDFIAFLLFDWDRKHRHDLQQFVLAFDVSDTGLRNIDLDFSSWLVSIRDYIPARIKVIYFVGIPFIIRPVIKLIISWLPERFKRIVHCGTFEALIEENIDEYNLPEEVGGRAGKRWRLAPVDSNWAHELEDENANKIFAKICEACSFSTTQEELDELYQMQREHDKKSMKTI